MASKNFSPEAATLKWNNGPRDGALRTQTATGLPNGCSAILFAEDVYGPRGGHRAYFGYQVFSADGRLICDEKYPAWERWVCIRNIFSVAERSGVSIAA